MCSAQIVDGLDKWARHIVSTLFCTFPAIAEFFARSNMSTSSLFLQEGRSLLVQFFSSVCFALLVLFSSHSTARVGKNPE